MATKLVWDKLFSGERERRSGTTQDHRNEFDKDYDRIVCSSSVRRLQDKAQVFPLQENDFTRTRLTHSMEASAIARSLGLAVEKWLLEEKEINEKYRGYLPSLLQVTALIHDLGNPPFGHYGEDIIGNWFEEWFETDEFKKINSKLSEEMKLKEEEKSDFINFEGNAQTLRIVTKLQMLNDQYGTNFTYATLATIMKYPWTSSNTTYVKKNFKKFGYFLAEKNISEKVHEKTGLKDGVRHPATFLLEASDDISYLCADIEDAVKKGIIPWEEEYNKIKDILLNSNKNKYSNMFKYLDDKKREAKEMQIPDFKLASIQNFKVMAQGMLIKGAIEAFKNNYKKIMIGEFGHESLIEHCELNDLVKELERLAKTYCFVDKEVLTLELVGDKVINGLLDIFVPTLMDCNKDLDQKTRKLSPKKKAGKLYELISSNFKFVCCFDYYANIKDGTKQINRFTDTRLYDRLLLITDFISGMTDSFAVNLYKELIGVKLP